MLEEQKDKNLSLFKKKLSKIVGFDVEFDFEDKLRDGTFSLKPNHTLTGEGTLLNTILYSLTVNALKINELLPEEKRCDKDTVVKICLLSHIAKAVRVIPNDNQWEIEKKGITFKYDPDAVPIRTGLHSLVLAQQAGITFTPEEAEAMTINDRDPSDEQARWHASRLSSVIRMANELTYVLSD